MLVEDYISLGLELGKHIPGLVDAYYGPGEFSQAAEHRPLIDPRHLADRARSLIAGIDAGDKLDHFDQSDSGQRRRWLKAQLIGLLTTARKLSGEEIDYLSEVKLCYGVAPRRVSKEEIDDAIGVLEQTFKGPGELRDRISAYRESFAVDPEKLPLILYDLSELLRNQTAMIFGLPEGEELEFEIVTGKPWSGFNYYLGNLKSKVAINSDLPVLSTSLAHLVAHEAYPGHHTEHSRKEVDLVNRRQQLEESIFLVGTPQCLLAEGLADFGLEILLGDNQFSEVSSLMIKRGINYPDQELEQTKAAFETLGKVRANAAWDLHQDGIPKDQVVMSLERDALLSRKRAEKSVEFLTDPTWRAYITCYVEGFQLVRNFVDNPRHPNHLSRYERFRKLISEQLIPADLNQ